jgi:NitT/TauT family transport system ATP-binding protein
MRQKVGFARALAVEPELLCLDEPFSALDVLSADALRGELLELWTSGTIPTKAILMVTHNIEEAVWLADRIVLMQKEPGRVVTEVKVILPYPRRRKSLPFLEVVDQVYAILAGLTHPEHVEMVTAPGEAGRTRALPHTTINALAGLLEHLHEAPQHRADIYQLAKDLKLTWASASWMAAVNMAGYNRASVPRLPSSPSDVAAVTVGTPSHFWQTSPMIRQLS